MDALKKLPHLVIRKSGLSLTIRACGFNLLDHVALGVVGELGHISEKSLARVSLLNAVLILE